MAKKTPEQEAFDRINASQQLPSTGKENTGNTEVDDWVLAYLRAWSIALDDMIMGTDEGVEPTLKGVMDDIPLGTSGTPIRGIDFDIKSENNFTPAMEKIEAGLAKIKDNSQKLLK